MNEGWFGFLSGLAAALIILVATNLAVRAEEKRRRLQEARYQIYVQLMELSGLLQLIAASEFRKETPDRSLQLKAREVSWQLADKLRAADDLSNLDDILDVLFSHGYPSLRDRLQSLDNVLSELGKMVNPRYKKIIRRIEDASWHRLEEDPSKRLNAPTSFL